ncbi:hypothetical protein LCGC14_0464550 [marine sediment metagenome]|uniref:Uncharacterized protein n=1 Tax=marine sediment metagenome TaxID=412755 RepID=A0A0F9VMS9_9ZZZZ
MDFLNLISEYIIWYALYLDILLGIILVLSVIDNKNKSSRYDKTIMRTTILFILMTSVLYGSLLIGLKTLDPIEHGMERYNFTERQFCQSHPPVDFESVKGNNRAAQTCCKHWDNEYFNTWYGVDLNTMRKEFGNICDVPGILQWNYRGTIFDEESTYRSWFYWTQAIRPEQPRDIEEIREQFERTQ